VRRRFSPEFVNRLDGIITYSPLSREALDKILDIQLLELRRHVVRRLGAKSFQVEVAKPARELLLAKGASANYGARELKRTIHKLLVQPMAALSVEGKLPPHSLVKVGVSSDGKRLRFRISKPPQTALRPAC
jgi:ATP-dependent Clp protease ATP-binding subunit ClpA